jgi:hypothetical protein
MRWLLEREDDRTRDVGGHEWLRALEHVLNDLWGIPGDGLELRDDDARLDGGDTHALARHLHAQRLGDGARGELAATVRAATWRHDPPSDRGGHYHMPGAALQHKRHAVPQRQQQPIDVRVEHVLPDIDVSLGDRAAIAEARVGDQDVELAPALQRRRDQPLNILWAAHIARDGCHLTPTSPAELFGQRSQAILPARRQRDIRATLRQRLRDCIAYPTACPSDDRDRAAQVSQFARCSLLLSHDDLLRDELMRMNALIVATNGYDLIYAL